jgi:hypothetical protein
MDGIAVLRDATADTTVARESITAGSTARWTVPGPFGAVVFMPRPSLPSRLYFNLDE